MLEASICVSFGLSGRRRVRCCSIGGGGRETGTYGQCGGTVGTAPAGPLIVRAFPRDGPGGCGGSPPLMAASCLLTASAGWLLCIGVGTIMGNGAANGAGIDGAGGIGGGAGGGKSPGAPPRPKP